MIYEILPSLLSKDPRCFSSQLLPPSLHAAVLLPRPLHPSLLIFHSCPLIHLPHSCLSEVLFFFSFLKKWHQFSLEPSRGFLLHLESPLCSSPWPMKPLHLALLLPPSHLVPASGFQPLQQGKLVPALAVLCFN